MSEHIAENGLLLDLIEREYEAFRHHHAAAQTLESPEGFARLFREWMARVIPPDKKERVVTAEWQANCEVNAESGLVCGMSEGLTKAEARETWGIYLSDDEFEEAWARQLDRFTASEMVKQALTSALHPEFGTEWREPDGVIWKAVQQAKRQAWAEGWRAFSRGISEKDNPYE